MFFTTKKRRGQRNEEKSSFSSSLRGFIFLESHTMRSKPPGVGLTDGDEGCARFEMRDALSVHALVGIAFA
jgi:hypothetical protein